jgi:hypothetical protein
MMNIDGLEKPDFSGLAASTAAREAYFLEFAVAMRGRVGMPLMVTGGFRTAAAMARAVDPEGIALVGLGRPLCVDPAAAAKLLDGAPALERWEDRLRVAPGWLGPRSPFALVKALNGFAMQSWYYQQLRRLGDGLPANPRLPVIVALVKERAATEAMAAAMRGLRTEG